MVLFRFIILSLFCHLGNLNCPFVVFEGFFCLYVCVVIACACVCREQTLMTMSSSAALHFMFETVSLTEARLTNHLDWLTIELQGWACLCLSSTTAPDTHRHAWLFTWVLGIQAQVSLLHSDYLTN